jgi:cell division protein FtsL
MKVVNTLLFLGVMATALAVVRTQHLARLEFVAVDDSKVALKQIEQDNTRLEVEKRAQATPLRVETIAKEKLYMRTTTPSITQYVDLPTSATPTGATAP